MEKLTEMLGAIKEAIDWTGLLGVLMVIAGISAGLYIGVWVCFIGGIAAFIEAIKADPVQALDAGISFARIWFSGVVGWASCLILVIPGAQLLK